MSTTHVSHQEQSFKAVVPGVELCVLRRHDNDVANPPLISEGSTILFRLAKGAHAPMHDHPGGEETYLISGILRVGERVLRAGDYLWTAPGESHDGFAEEACTFFVVLPGGLKLMAG